MFYFIGGKIRNIVINNMFKMLKLFVDYGKIKNKLVKF